jgi:hypothetical protein
MREWERKDIKWQRLTKVKIKRGKRLEFGDEKKAGEGGRGHAPLLSKAWRERLVGVFLPQCRRGRDRGVLCRGEGPTRCLWRRMSLRDSRIESGDKRSW